MSRPKPDLSPAVVVSAERAERDEASVELKLPTLAAWYWFRGSKSEEDDDAPFRGAWIGCVTHIGSNYAEVTGPGGGSQRFHLDRWEDIAVPAEDASGYFKRRGLAAKNHAAALMDEIRELAASLNLPTDTAQISEVGMTTQALATRGSGEALPKYKEALTKAKKETLPELNRQIQKALETYAFWMKAELVPMQAQVRELGKLSEHIEDRVFNVTLYAGLTEEVKCIAEGKPAPAATQIHVFQRRHYMDEECLVGYEAGGMKFQDMSAFDTWLAKPVNRDRILPHARCIVAFRIRRFDRTYEFGSLSDFISFVNSGQRDADKKTYLYMRNGEQLYRLETDVDFDEQLFPDDQQWALMPGQAYATRDGSEVISQGEYEQMRFDEAAALKEWRQDQAVKLWGFRGYRRDYPALKAAYETAMAQYEIDHDRYGMAWSRWRMSGSDRRKAPVAPVRPSVPKEPRFRVEHWGEPHARSNKFEPWNRDNVYADDVSEKVQKRIAAHNRTVLVIQGLLDRSPIWNPHPRWELWDPTGFKAALVLVYDDARALVAGEKPDFEAYRAGLHAQITSDSVFVGQRRIWLEEEAKKENARRDRDHRRKNDWQVTVYDPPGNRGPKRVSAADKVTRTQATFRWTRRRERVKRDWSGRTDDSPIPVSLSVPLEKLFNVSAYKPGDFRTFFADVRTRAEYVQWAPFLLAAEDWHGAPTKPVEDDEDGYHDREIG